MILKAHKREENKSKEEKQVEKWYEEYCIANGIYDHMTDKQLNNEYNKRYLLKGGD